MSESLAAVASSGSRLETLKALRDYLAEALDDCGSPRDQAALSRQLTDVLVQIEELAPPTEEVDPLADLVPDGD